MLYGTGGIVDAKSKYQIVPLTDRVCLSDTTLPGGEGDGSVRSRPPGLSTFSSFPDEVFLVSSNSSNYTFHLLCYR